jgi:hypothetical protein
MTFDEINKMDYTELNMMKTNDDFNPTDIISDDANNEESDDEILKKFHKDKSESATPNNKDTNQTPYTVNN